MHLITFPSKLSTGILTWTLLVLTAVGGIMVYERAWMVIGILALTAAFVLHLLLTTKYIIAGQTLQIRCGFFYRQTIAIKSIKTIKSSRDISTAPAASLQRLEILFNQRERVLVSPKDQDGFIGALLELNPGIEVNLQAG